MPINEESVVGKSLGPSPSQLVRRVLEEAGYPMTVDELIPRVKRIAVQNTVPSPLNLARDWFVRVGEDRWWLIDEKPTQERPAVLATGALCRWSGCEQPSTAHRGYCKSHDREIRMIERTDRRERQKVAASLT